MYSIITLYALFWFILATLFFYLALQQPLNCFRRILIISHILSIAICLRGGDLGLAPYTYAWVTFIFGLTLHTTSTLIIEKRTLKLESSSFIQRLRTTFQIWTNFRRLSLVHRDVATTSQESTNRGIFTFLKCGHILALYVAHHLITNIISYILRPLNIMLWDFAPAKQGLVPPLTYRDLSLRAVMSIQWIWSTYMILTGAHDILAIVFVSVLRWDLPVQWPALFGSIAEAYSMRRFWGVFWHRLHIAVFEAYMPTFLLRFYDQQCNWQAQQQHARYSTIRKGFRAFWIFLSSAICHSVVHWIVSGKGNTAQQINFFLSNYALCLVETVAGRVLEGKVVSKGSLWARLFGYAWVLGVFFTIVPAWQYSLIYAVAGF